MSTTSPDRPRYSACARTYGNEKPLDLPEQRRDVEPGGVVQDRLPGLLQERDRQADEPAHQRGRLIFLPSKRVKPTTRTAFARSSLRSTQGGMNVVSDMPLAAAVTPSRPNPSQNIAPSTSAKATRRQPLARAAAPAVRRSRRSASPPLSHRPGNPDTEPTTPGLSRDARQLSVYAVEHERQVRPAPPTLPRPTRSRQNRSVAADKSEEKRQEGDLVRRNPRRAAGTRAPPAGGTPSC